MKLPTLIGIAVRAERLDEGSSQLTVTLLSDGDEDIFRALCANLIEATRNISSEQDETIASIILIRLERWRNLLRDRRDRSLSKAQQLGLFGELSVLEDLFFAELSPLDAIAAWRGPRSDEQDFLLGDWLFEVKSQISTADQVVKIASQHQLDPISGSIILCHQTFGISPESSAEGRSLNEIVRDVRSTAREGGAAASDLLESNLLEVGYEASTEYDAEKLVLSQRRFFRVQDEFPRIVASDLRSGIQDVSYSIRLRDCLSWQIEDPTFYRLMFSTDD